MANPSDSGSGKPKAAVSPPAQAARPAARPPAPPAIAPAIAPVAPKVPAVAPIAARPPGPQAPKPPAPAPAAPAPDLDPKQLADLEQRWAKLDELDYFQVLKLEKTAVPAQIKQAFYAESRTYHPDRFFHLKDAVLKEKVTDLYKRVTEAYYVLRDDAKRRRYATDVSGPERAQKLRFTEASEAETKQQAKKEQEEQIGTTPKGRQFYQTAMKEHGNSNWSGAERNLKMALTFEPSNAKYKERLLEVQQKINEASKQSGQGFKIK